MDEELLEGAQLEVLAPEVVARVRRRVDLALQSAVEQLHLLLEVGAHLASDAQHVRVDVCNRNKSVLSFCSHSVIVS